MKCVYAIGMTQYEMYEQYKEYEYHTELLKLAIMISCHRKKHNGTREYTARKIYTYILLYYHT
jgi:hypothetical protein